jgi:hypothetical protein
MGTIPFLFRDLRCTRHFCPRSGGMYTNRTLRAIICHQDGISAGLGLSDGGAEERASATQGARGLKSAARARYAAAARARVITTVAKKRFSSAVLLVIDGTFDKGAVINGFCKYCRNT